MVRTLRIACLFTLLAAALSGCNLPPAALEPTPTIAEAPPTIGSEPTEALPPGTTSIVFWEPFALDRPQGILLSEMVLDFQTANPDTLVKLVAKSGYTSIHDAMLAELPNGDLPDMAVSFPSMIAQYAATGAVVPLDAYLSDPEVGMDAEDLADICPACLESGRLPGFGEQLLAFPFAQNAIGMWVNRTLLSKAGWKHAPATWAEFEQACFDVWAIVGVRCYPFIESVTTFDAWLYSRGGAQLNEAGQMAAFNGPAGVEGLSLLRRLIDAGLAWRPADPYGDYVAFANGQAAFTFSSTGSSSLYVDAYQGALGNKVEPFRWDQVLIPQADPDHPATALYGTSFFIMRSDPFRERAAWRLIRWFGAKEQTARWSSRLEALPVRASALEVMTDTLEAYPFVRAQVEEILPYARSAPAMGWEFELHDILYTSIVSVTQGYADPQGALDQAARKVDALLAGGQ